MRFSSFSIASALIALAPFAATQQHEGDDPNPPHQPASLLLKYATFDPVEGVPDVPPGLRVGLDTGLWIVQFNGVPTDDHRDAVTDLGATIHSYLPDHAYIVRMPAHTAAGVRQAWGVRWVGAYEPAYRLEHELLWSIQNGVVIPKQKYNIVVVDKHTRQAGARARKIRRDRRARSSNEHGGQHPVRGHARRAHSSIAGRTASMRSCGSTAGRRSELDMDNARIQGGGNYVETSAAGYTGNGVNGHIYEGIEATHVDFTNTPVTAIGCGGADNDTVTARPGSCSATASSHPERTRHGAGRDSRSSPNSGLAARARATRLIVQQLVTTHQVHVHDSVVGQRAGRRSLHVDLGRRRRHHLRPSTSRGRRARANAAQPGLPRREAWAKNIFSMRRRRPLQQLEPGQ